MQFEIETSHALPTPDEIFALLPELLAATKELTPRDPSRPLLVLDTLTPAWSNVDFEPNLAALPLRDRAFVERQIERTHRAPLAPPNSPLSVELSRSSRL